jgi:hypothetical protein
MIFKHTIFFLFKKKISFSIDFLGNKLHCYEVTLPHVRVKLFQSTKDSWPC